MAQHVAGIAVIGFGVAGRMAREFAAVGVVVAVHAQIAARLGEHRAAFVGQHLQTVFGQFQIAHDLGAKQAADIRAVGIGETGVKLPADRSAANPVIFLDHADF